MPFAGFVTDPCDGRTQGTPGMMDSLPYRNDAAIVFRRLIRSLPTRRGVLGVATCDKGLPAMMMALAGAARPARRARARRRDAAADATARTPARSRRSAPASPTARSRCEEAAELGCRACAHARRRLPVPRAPRRRRRWSAEALGLALPHSALAPSGQPIWLDMARRSARALLDLAAARSSTTRDILTDAAVRNAMVVHAAFGGSTNLLLHIPAIAYAAGLRRPTVEDWTRVNRSVPRLVDVLPNGPVDHPTVRVFLAGGVPEVMLHLRELGLLDGWMPSPCTGEPLGDVLDWWERSDAAHARARAAARARRRRPRRRRS